MNNQDSNQPTMALEKEQAPNEATFDMAAVKRWMAGEVRINISRGWLLAGGLFVLILGFVALD
jgi:hypothetical protein